MNACGRATCEERRTHWSHMACDHRKPPHVPHVWDGPYTIYGPYLCEGNHPEYIGRHRGGR